MFHVSATPSVDRRPVAPAHGGGPAFRAQSHLAVLNSVVADVVAGSGIVAVRGETGAGKTQLAHAASQTLRHAGMLSVSVDGCGPIDPLQIHRRLAEAAGVASAASLGPWELCRAVADRAGSARVVLVLDDAHRLDTALFRALVLLKTAFDTESTGLTLVLLGNPGPWRGLDAPDLQQLRQQSFSRYTLFPLSDGEARSFLRHRLRVAGLRGRRMLTRAAEYALVRQGDGLPASLVELLDRALASRRTRPRRLTLRMVWPFVSPDPSWLLPLGAASLRSPAGLVAGLALVTAAACATGYAIDPASGVRASAWAENLLRRQPAAMRIALSNAPEPAAGLPSASPQAAPLPAEIQVPLLAEPVVSGPGPAEPIEMAATKPQSEAPAGEIAIALGAAADEPAPATNPLATGIPLELQTPEVQTQEVQSLAPAITPAQLEASAEPSAPPPEAGLPQAAVASEVPTERQPSAEAAESAPIAPRGPRGGPGLVLVAGAGDDLPSLYARVYRGVTPPPYTALLSVNPLPIRQGALLIFPAPPDGWPHR